VIRDRAGRKSSTRRTRSAHLRQTLGRDVVRLRRAGCLIDPLKPQRPGFVTCRDDDVESLSRRVTGSHEYDTATGCEIHSGRTKPGHYSSIGTRWHFAPKNGSNPHSTPAVVSLTIPITAALTMTDGIGQTLVITCHRCRSLGRASSRPMAPAKRHHHIRIR
jgi:hypothetical protein